MYKRRVCGPMYKRSVHDPVYRSVHDPIYRSVHGPMYKRTVRDPVYRRSVRGPIYKRSVCGPVYRRVRGPCTREVSAAPSIGEESVAPCTREVSVAPSTGVSMAPCTREVSGALSTGEESVAPSAGPGGFSYFNFRSEKPWCVCWQLKLGFHLWWIISPVLDACNHCYAFACCPSAHPSALTAAVPVRTQPFTQTLTSDLSYPHCLTTLWLQQLLDRQVR